MTNNNTVRYKMVDGEVYLHAEDLQCDVKNQSNAVAKILRSAWDYAGADRVEIVLTSVIDKIGRYRTLALAREAKQRATNDLVETLIDKLLFRD